MPKLPLFEGEPLLEDVVDRFKNLFRNPSTPGDMELIDCLLDLHANPVGPMPATLAWHVAELNLISGCVQNMFLSTFDRERLGSYHTRARVDMHRWVLAHAAAAGFLPLPAALVQPEKTPKPLSRQRSCPEEAKRSGG